MFEILAKSFGRQSRKNEKARNEQRAHQSHAQHDDDGAKHSKQSIVEFGINTDGVGELFVESDGKNFVVKNDIKTDDETRHNPG